MGGSIKACFSRCSKSYRLHFVETACVAVQEGEKKANLSQARPVVLSLGPNATSTTRNHSVDEVTLASEVTIRKESKSYRMSAIQNLQTYDPFADATKGDDCLPTGKEDYIHIRIQQRNGRKTLTTVQGIAAEYDKKKLVKAFKKKFACNGTVIEHPEYGEVIQLQGDQRKHICQFLIEIDLAKEEQLKVHGF